MGRAPCCEKMGLKKGPWIHDEDQILVSYIQKHGHGNWRALPKQAGLLRCGKSCRLRWTNYLRPDIKRGNFTKEEEDTIINLHEMLGNRWSMIAAKLPGRTDNEIKNVWHTHLKKRLPSYQNTNQGTKRHATTKSESGSNDHLSSQLKQEPTVSQNLFEPEASCAVEQPVSPQHSSSELSSVTETTTDSSVLVKHEQMDYNSSETFLDDSFWSEALSGEESSMVESNLSDGLGLEFPMPSYAMMENIDKRNPDGDDDSVDFWYNIFTRAEELPELPEF